MTENKDKEKDGLIQYNKLKDQYALPEFKDLDKEFNIDHLEYSNFLLRQVMHKMSERMDNVAKILHDIIQPDNTITGLYETEVFSEEEKKKIFELFKKVAYYDKELLIIDYDYDEARAAQMIKTTFNILLNIKPEFIDILNKAKKAWNHNDKQKIEPGYFG